MGDPVENIRWGLIWTDEQIIQSVLEQYESFLDKVRKGEFRIKFPFFEYNYVPSSKQSIYFADKVIDLSEKLKISSVREIFNLINQQKTFCPFITQMVGRLILTFHAPEYCKLILRYVLKLINKRKGKIGLEIKKLLRLPDYMLMQKMIESGEIKQGILPWNIPEKYVKMLEPKYPNIRQEILKEACREKPAIKAEFLGKKYIVYFFESEGRPVPFPIYFPLEASSSLPNAPSFLGKILGIVSLTPNPPLNATRQLSPFFLRAFSLFIGYNYSES